MATEDVTARLRLSGRPEFVRDADAAGDSIERMGDRADRAGRHFSGLGSFAGALRGPLGLVGGVARTAAVGVTVLGGAAVAGGLALLNMASDAAETQSKFATVFGTGESDEVTSWIRGIQSDVHIATQELQDAASTFGVFGQAVGVPQANLGEFSTALAQAGLDLASFSNANPEDVFLALRSGLAGESEPLRQFGIFLSDASLNAFAAANGINKTTAEMTEQEKVLLRQQFILANLGAAEGDLARTSQGVANQTRGMKGAFKDLGTEIGNVLTPAAEKLLPLLTEGLGEIVERLRDNLPDLQRRVGDWSDSLVRLYRTIRDGRIDTEGFDTQIEAVFGESFGGALNTAIDLIRTLRTNIGEAGAEQGFVDTIEGLFGEGVASTVERILAAGEDIGILFRDTLVPAWQSAQDTLGPLAGASLTVLAEALGWAADNAEELAPYVHAIFVAWITSRTVSTVTGLATAVRSLGGAMGFAAVAGGGATGAGGLTGVLARVGPMLVSVTAGIAAFLAIAPFAMGYRDEAIAAYERGPHTPESEALRQEAWGWPEALPPGGGPVQIGGPGLSPESPHVVHPVVPRPDAVPQQHPAGGGVQERSGGTGGVTVNLGGVTVADMSDRTAAERWIRNFGREVAEEIDRVLQVRTARG
jgi:hypothetical protein